MKCLIKYNISYKFISEEISEIIKLYKKYRHENK